MLKLVGKIEAEEKERRQLMAECKNDEERIKLHQKFIELKTASQKQIKDVMSKHKKEMAYLEKEALSDQINRQKRLNEKDHHLENEHEDHQEHDHEHENELEHQDEAQPNEEEFLEEENQGEEDGNAVPVDQ